MLVFDVTEAIRELRAIRAQLAAERPALLRQWGRAVLDRTHADFLVKARGGTGSDGITWSPLRPSTIRRNRGRTVIGVATGELTAPAGDALTVRRYSVQAGFGDPHAEFFDEARPLLPDVLPDPWRAHIEQLTTEWALSILQPLD